MAWLRDVCETSKIGMDHETACREARRARRRTRELITEYRCRDCGWWHVGHPSHGKDRRRKRQRVVR